MWIEAYGLKAQCDVAVENGRARRYEPGATEEAFATADGIDNNALRRRVAELGSHVADQTAVTLGGRL